MKKYLFILIILIFSRQLFAQEDLAERYQIPEGQIIKLYKESNEGKAYFFDTSIYNKTGLIYFKYLLLKNPNILTLKKNARTPMITIVVTNKLKRKDLEEQILEAIEEFTYVIKNYDNYAEEIENLIYLGDN